MADLAACVEVSFTGEVSGAAPTSTRAAAMLVLSLVVAPSSSGCLLQLAINQECRHGAVLERVLRHPP